MIDWKKIAEDNPGAYEVMWCGFLLANKPPKLPGAKFRDEIGHLLAFFDEQEIYIQPYRDLPGYDTWMIIIETTVCEVWPAVTELDRPVYKNRTEAYIAAIPEAFNILERSL